MASKIHVLSDFYFPSRICPCCKITARTDMDMKEFHVSFLEWIIFQHISILRLELSYRVPVPLPETST